MRLRPATASVIPKKFTLVCCRIVLSCIEIIYESVFDVLTRTVHFDSDEGPAASRCCSSTICAPLRLNTVAVK